MSIKKKEFGGPILQTAVVSAELHKEKEKKKKKDRLVRFDISGVMRRRRGEKKIIYFNISMMAINNTVRTE